MKASIELAPGSEENGLAVMLADLVRQNLEAKPHKRRDFDALSGSFAIVADDADVALTLRFASGRLTIHDGIVGIPDVTIRGQADTIIALSNLPILKGVGLPIPNPRDRDAMQAARVVMDAMRAKKLHVYGMAFHAPMVMRLTRVMSVNG